ncbi:MAG: extensin family protein [Pseudomonadota bacterium]
MRLRLNRRRTLALAIAALSVLVLFYVRFAPDRYDITAPLSLIEPPTVVTPFKLKLMGVEACYAALDQASVRYEKLSDRETGRGCGFHQSVLIKQTSVPWGEGLSLTCPMAAALVMWERHDLQPAAQERFGKPVVLIENYGSYACRNINNAARGSRSEHARANAIDISGFVLQGGTSIAVRRDWRGRDDEARFLRRLHRSGCFYFNTVLGPDYNALHEDHFHFDQGNYRSCR